MSLFLHKLLVAETDNTLTQMFRYLIVGGIAFLADYSLLYILTEGLHLHYLLSATVSFVAGLIVNYLISTLWIFRHSKLNNRMAEFAVYAIIGVVGLLFNNLLMYLFTDCLNIHYMLSKLITAALVMCWNFLGRKYILFNTK